jgi:L-asparaginase / beta-aspartyl-peptidase
MIAMAVHGGAGLLPSDLLDAHREGCRSALQRGLAVLSAGGSALDAVQRSVVELENDETFDAGYGSFLNRDGQVECDAGIMDGARLVTGSVCAVSGVPNPVLLAKSVLESPLAVLVAGGAVEFAVEHGVEVCDPERLVSPRARRLWDAHRGHGWDEADSRSLFGDTVGAVALDRAGDLAAATSTGGMPGKLPGRVGDSPFIGTGVYANNATAAVSTTGHGELIIPIVWAKSAADLINSGMSTKEAAQLSIQLLAPTSAKGGLIMVDRRGVPAVAWNTPHLAFAYLDPGTGEIVDGPRMGSL